MLEMLTKFYGLDFLISFLYILHAWLIGQRHRSGWVIGIVASVLNIWFSIWIGSIASIIVSISYVLIHAKSYINWSKIS